MAKRKPIESQSTPAESFEASLTELQQIVADLEDGSLGLEASLARFEQGVGLLRTCTVLLESVEQKIETLTRLDDPALASPPIGNNGDLDDNAERGHESVDVPDKHASKPSLF